MSETEVRALIASIRLELEKDISEIENRLDLIDDNTRRNERNFDSLSFDVEEVKRDLGNLEDDVRSLDV